MNSKKLSASVMSVTLLLMIPGIGAPAEDLGSAGPMPIALSQVVAEAVLNNPTVREARLQWLIRQARERGAWGDFEPALAAGAGQSSLKRENTALQQLSQLGMTQYSEKKKDYNLGVEGRFVSGANYKLGYTLSQTDSDLTNGNEYESNLGLSVDQPLMKGATRRAPFAAIRVARQESLVAFHNYRKQLMSIVAGLESAYWDLALAQEQNLIAEDSVRIAREILADARERVAVGKLSELDQTEAEIQLNIRLAGQDQSALAVSEAAARLQILLGGGAIGSAAAVNATEPLEWDSSTSELFRAKAQTMVEDALLLQPDIAMRRAELQKNRIQLDYQRDQRLPELTAKGQVGFQGLGDSANASLQTLQSQEFPTWSLSLQFRLPLAGGIQAGSAEMEARLTMGLTASQIAAAVRETTVTVQTLLQRVRTYERLAESAHAVSGYKSQLLDVERQRFDAGKSDVRKIFEVEQSLSESRDAELQSYDRLRKATADVEAASGTILRDQALEHVIAGQIELAPELLRQEPRS
jgi:outer membrane protein TolC